MGLLQLLQPHRELFLKASLSCESAPRALEGLGTWGLIPTFLRYSKPRWTCTFFKPRSSSLQSATLGPFHIPPPGGVSSTIARRNRACPSSSSNALCLAPGLEWRRSPSPSTPSES